MTDRSMPEVGDVAPDINAATATGGRFSLSEDLGKWVVVYFYPRANTPGWTHEAKDFQDHRGELESLNALVVGVSADKAVVQLKFVEKFGLTFPMVPNPERDIIAAYGTETVLGVTAQRSTFLVSPDGHIAHVWPKVQVDGHADDVVATIRKLAAA